MMPDNMMNKYEKLLDEAESEHICVDEKYPFKGNTLGLYIDQNIALSDRLDTTAEKSCILAEELGHHYTSCGNILDTSCPTNAKQERQARLWAYDKQIGLHGLIAAYEHGCRERHEIVEFLEVTDEFLEGAVACYQEKYGAHTTYNGYYIVFIPSLMIGKLFKRN